MDQADLAPVDSESSDGCDEHGKYQIKQFEPPRDRMKIHEIFLRRQKIILQV